MSKCHLWVHPRQFKFPFFMEENKSFENLLNGNQSDMLQMSNEACWQMYGLVQTVFVCLLTTLFRHITCDMAVQMLFQIAKHHIHIQSRTCSESNM